MPPDDCLGLNNHERLFPTRPPTPQDDPEHTIRNREPRLRMSRHQDGKLLPQGQVFQEQIATRTKEADYHDVQEPQRTKHVSVVAGKVNIQVKSAIRFATMLDGENEDGVSVVVEADTIVADA
jgi:hypothetical protein